MHEQRGPKDTSMKLINLNIMVFVSSKNVVVEQLSTLENFFLRDGYQACVP